MQCLSLVMISDKQRRSAAPGEGLFLMYMLDTNICIYVLQNRTKRLRHRFKVEKDLCISSVTYAELCFGIENSAPSLRSKRWEQLDLFTRLLHIEALDWKTGRHYG